MVLVILSVGRLQSDPSLPTHFSSLLLKKGGSDVHDNIRISARATNKAHQIVLVVRTM